MSQEERRMYHKTWVVLGVLIAVMVALPWRLQVTVNQAEAFPPSQSGDVESGVFSLSKGKLLSSVLDVTGGNLVIEPGTGTNGLQLSVRDGGTKEVRILCDTTGCAVGDAPTIPTTKTGNFWIKGDARLYGSTNATYYVGQDNASNWGYVRYNTSGELELFSNLSGTGNTPINIAGAGLRHRTFTTSASALACTSARVGTEIYIGGAGVADANAGPCHCQLSDTHTRYEKPDGTACP